MYLLLLFFSLLAIKASSTPVRSPSPDSRQQKSLYYDYLQQEEEPAEFNPYDTDTDEYVSLPLEDNDLSRTIPTRKRIRNRPYNSPVYYIRLPPQPYMFVPGLGYVSQPPPSAMSQFVNLPVSFVSNGKPSTIYQWGGGLESFPTVPPPAQALPPVVAPLRPKPQPPKLTESQVHRLPGQFTFNGKPNDIFVLGDSYNSLYGDALQNFYP